MDCTRRIWWNWALGVAVACGLLFASNTAEAQYKHFSIGASASFLLTSNIGGTPAAPANSVSNQGYGVGPSYLVIGAHGGWRFEDRFMLVFETHLGFHSCGFPNNVCSVGSTPMTLSVFTDFRIFFLTDSFRPYIDLGLGYWQSIAFIKSNLSSFGPTVTLGFEWFFMEELAFGLQARYGLQLVVGNIGLEVFHNLHAGLVFSAYL